MPDTWAYVTEHANTLSIFGNFQLEGWTRFWTPDLWTMKEQISVVLNHQICGNLLHRNLIQSIGVYPMVLGQVVYLFWCVSVFSGNVNFLDIFSFGILFRIHSFYWVLSVWASRDQYGRWLAGLVDLLKKSLDIGQNSCEQVTQKPHYFRKEKEYSLLYIECSSVQFSSVN